MNAFVGEELLLPPALAPLWTRTVAAWSDPGAHQAFLSQAVVLGALAQAGRAYRIALARSPQDPRALAGRDEVLRHAMSPALVSAKDPAAQASTARTVLVVGLVALAVLLSVLAFFVL